MKYGITIGNCQLNATVHESSLKCPNDHFKIENNVCVCNGDYIGPDCRSIYNYIIIIIM